MTWNYRIVEYQKGGFGLHEVYYEDGEPAGMTQEPATFTGDTKTDIRDALSNALSDAETRGIFKEPEDWLPKEE